MDLSAGRRSMQTLRKLPTAMPINAAKATLKISIQYILPALRRHVNRTAHPGPLRKVDAPLVDTTSVAPVLTLIKLSACVRSLHKDNKLSRLIKPSR